VTVYQAFPTPTRVPAGPAPASVRRAVYLMYAGAAISLISGIVGVITVANAKPGFFPTTSAPGSHVPGAVVGAVSIVVVVVAVLSIVVPIVLWLWMAWKCKAGRPWARVVSTVLFGLATFATLTSLVGTSAWGMAGMIASWLAGLGATILLWQRASSWYFRPGPRY